jgi:tetratricopeptide (TPR) repeat protein
LTSGPATLFGRERELEYIERLASRARTGIGSLVLLSGEAGIGKSTLGREVGARASAAGMRVLAGRCWEAGGAAPYWPWVQVFRGLQSTPFEGLLREESGDSQQRRFQLFDAATRALTTSAAKCPLLLFLEDLHAADRPSLLLLLFLAREAPSWPLLVLGTSRKVETQTAPEVADLLAKISREGEVVSLRRLTKDDVAAWVTQSDRPVSNADDVFRVTEGNPLFVQEVLRVGADGSRPLTSDGMKATLDEHLSKLSPEARTTLEAAAILGRDFESRELAEVLARSHDVVLDSLRHAATLGVLEAMEREHFQFTHVLLRDRLHETLPALRRSELHWKAGLIAEKRGADSIRIANHLLEGADAGNAERAAASALGAAEKALPKLAFEAAAELAGRGLSRLGAERSRLACKLEITWGEGLIRSGSVAAGRARCARAAVMAKALGCAEEQAHAALVYGSELTVGPGGPVIDPDMVRLLEEALAAIGTGDSTLRARLGVRLAAARTPPQTEEAAYGIVDLARASLAMARRMGDADALLYALEFASHSLTYMVPSEERVDLLQETIALAQKLDRRLTLMKLGSSYAISYLERGQRREADAALSALVDLHAQLDFPQTRWRVPMLHAGFCLFDGRLDEAEQLGDQALAIGDRNGSRLASVEWAYQRIALALARSEPASVEPHAFRMLSVFDHSPLARSHRAWVLGAMGRREEAKTQLREAAAMTQGLPTLIVAAEACTLLDDSEAAAAVLEQLKKRAFGTTFFWGSSGGHALGPVVRAFGDLARLLGRREEARHSYEESVALCRRIGAKPFLELSLAALSRLDAEESPGKSQEPAGAAPAAIPAAVTHQPSRPASRDILLIREGDVWAIESPSGSVFRLKHSKGLSYLNELLAHPGQELHVLSLVGLDHGAGDAGPILDARAKAEYRTRLDALEDEISEADGFGDIGRANRAREELEVLAQQLAGAVGLGGRDRRAASDSERARINVQRRLKDAIESVGDCDADLGRYLAATVKTGTYCSFTPL